MVAWVGSACTSTNPLCSKRRVRVCPDVCFALSSPVSGNQKAKFEIQLCRQKHSVRADIDFITWLKNNTLHVWSSNNITLEFKILVPPNTPVNGAYIRKWCIHVPSLYCRLLLVSVGGDQARYVFFLRLSWICCFKILALLLGYCCSVFKKVLFLIVLQLA